MKTPWKWLACAGLAAIAPLAAHAGCVNPAGTGGCLASIQAAIDAAADNETIDIAAGTYFENRIRMNRQVNLRGAGRALTIVDGSVDNGNGTRSNGAGPAVIYYSVFSDPQVATTISDLTIRGGYRGVDAGRFNTTTLLRVRLTANGPGSGAGAFINAEKLIVRESLIDHNNAVDGLGCDWYWGGGGGGGLGAGCGGGTIQVYDSVVTGNTAMGLGGGLLMGGFDDVVENTVVADNSAGEYGLPSNFGIGGALLTGFGKIRYSTFAHNAGGGLFASDAMTMIASLVQGNTGPGGNCWNGVPTSLGYNIAADATCLFNHPTDLVSTPIAMVTEVDPGIGMPVTHPDTASVAIDRIPANACDIAADIGDVPRPQGAGCDVGAVEWVQPPPQVVLCVNTVPVEGCYTSIAAAIAAAPEGAKVKIGNGSYFESNLLVDKSLTLEGSGGTVIDGRIPGSSPAANGPNPVIVLPAGGTSVAVMLRALTVTRGYRGIDAGRDNDLALEDMTVSYNGNGSGAGLLNYTSRVSIVRTRIFNNSALSPLACAGGIWGTGGGVAQLCNGANQGYTHIRDSSIYNNTAGASGGGVTLRGSGYLLENVTLDRNTTQQSGAGAAGFFYGNGTIRYTTVTQNTAAFTTGGGLSVSGGTAEFFANLLQGNSGNACTGSFHSLGYNVSNDASCGLAALGDRPSRSVVLNPLSFYGGPQYVWTRPMAAQGNVSSAGMNIIPPALCAMDHDARGATRPAGSGCEPGAHEGSYN